MTRSPYIYILFFLLLTLILGLVLIYPQYQELTLVKEKIEEKKTELQSKEEYLSNLQKTSEKLNQYETELSVLDSALPSDPSLPSLFAYLQKTASENGLILKEMSPATSLPSEGPQETRIHIKMTGLYPSLKTFLTDLENSARMIEVDSVYFASPKKEGPFDFEIEIKVYSY